MGRGRQGCLSLKRSVGWYLTYVPERVNEQGQHVDSAWRVVFHCLHCGEELHGQVFEHFLQDVKSGRLEKANGRWLSDSI